MRRSLACAVALSALGGCGKLQNFGGPETPLVTFDVRFDGDLAPLRPPGIQSEHALKVALVWGAQWLTEPFCILPPESKDAAAVIAAGCRDPLGFVPARVDTSASIVIGQQTSLSLFQLPSADLLIGDVTARVAYGSFVVYDDRNDNDTLDLSQPHRTPAGGRGEPDEEPPDSADVIYGASFVTMTEPDQRAAYREGAFNVNGAYYPRAGCDPPLPAFSVLGAGGFSSAAAVAATLAGTLPQEPAGTCARAVPSDALVAVSARAPAEVDEVGCDESSVTGSPRYREPPATQPDFTGRTVACAHLPSFDTGGGLGGAGDGGAATDAGTDGGPGAEAASSLVQLVVSSRATDRCKGLTHYVLRGCRESVTCALPDWDFTATPSAVPWWPCQR